MNNEMIFQGSAELQDLANAAMNEPSPSAQELEEMGFVKASNKLNQDLEDCPF